MIMIALFLPRRLSRGLKRTADAARLGPSRSAALRPEILEAIGTDFQGNNNDDHVRLSTYGSSRDLLSLNYR